MVGPGAMGSGKGGIELFVTTGDEREGFGSTGEFGLLYLVYARCSKIRLAHIHNPLVRVLMLGGCVCVWKCMEVDVYMFA